MVEVVIAFVCRLKEAQATWAGTHQANALYISRCSQPVQVVGILVGKYTENHTNFFYGLVHSYFSN